jgi:hypothetical protein
MKFGNLSINPATLVAFRKNQTNWGEGSRNNFFIDAILTKEAQEGYHSSVKPYVCFDGEKYASDVETKEARDTYFDSLNKELDELYKASLALAIQNERKLLDTKEE